MAFSGLWAYAKQAMEIVLLQREALTEQDTRPIVEVTNHIVPNQLLSQQSAIESTINYWGHNKLLSPQSTIESTIDYWVQVLTLQEVKPESDTAKDPQYGLQPRLLSLPYVLPPLLLL